MKSFLRSALIVGAAAATLPADALNPTKSLPYVGTLLAVDPEARQLTVQGPDQQKFTVSMRGRYVLSNTLGREGAVPLEKLEEKKGERIGMFLRTKTDAMMVALLDEEPAEFNGYPRRLREEVKRIVFTTEDRHSLAVKPAVNLGAVEVDGGKPMRAGWKWFEQNLNKPFTVTTVQLHGTEYIWSIAPWKPEEKEDE